MAHSPTDPFGSAKRRLARAEAHIRDFKRRESAFHDRKTYRQVIHPHPDGIHEIYKLKARRKTLPSYFSDIATDALENLRAALDHAVYAIALANPRTPRDTLHRIYFPFCTKATDLSSSITKNCPGFPKEITALFDDFEPYKGGSDYIWALNELVRISKHKSLTAIMVNVSLVRCGGTMGFIDFTRHPAWDKANNEIVLGTALHRDEYKPAYQVTLRFQIGFEDIVPGEPIAYALIIMASRVDSMIRRLEDESKRIGLFP